MIDPNITREKVEEGRLRGMWLICANWGVSNIKSNNSINKSWCLNQRSGLIHFMNTYHSLMYWCRRILQDKLYAGWSRCPFNEINVIMMISRIFIHMLLTKRWKHNTSVMITNDKHSTSPSIPWLCTRWIDIQKVGWLKKGKFKNTRMRGWWRGAASSFLLLSSSCCVVVVLLCSCDVLHVEVTQERERERETNSQKRKRCTFK